MSNLYQYNLQNTVKNQPIEEVKGIVLDSMLPPLTYRDNKDNINKPLPEDMIVPHYLSLNIPLSKHSVLYNYLIDKQGDVHELFPMKYAAHCCTFNEYSYAASRLFLKSLNNMTNLASQINLSYDQETISICTITDRAGDSADSGRMTSECYKSLLNLIEYILCRLFNEYETTLNSNHIYLRSMFPTNNATIGHMFFKKNVAHLLILKRDITHSVNMFRHTKKYQNMFTIIQR